MSAPRRPGLTLAERSRIAGVGEYRPSRSAAPTPATRTDSPARHCWVTDPPGFPAGRFPGLLLEWEQNEQGQWRGRIAFAVVHAGQPMLVEGWIDQRHLAPG